MRVCCACAQKMRRTKRVNIIYLAMLKLCFSKRSTCRDSIRNKIVTSKMVNTGTSFWTEGEVKFIFRNF